MLQVAATYMLRKVDMSSTMCNVLLQLATRVSRDTHKNTNAATLRDKLNETVARITRSLIVYVFH